MPTAEGSEAFDAGASGQAGGRSTVIVVCSPRPRVGKTLLARLLVDFLLTGGHRVLAFDANPRDPVLSEYLPAAPATITNTPGQMALFDRLIVHDGIWKIVDLASDQFDRFLEILRQIDFAGEARARSIDTVLLYVAENHPRSAEPYQVLQAAFPDTTLALVLNDVIENYGTPRVPHPAAGVVSVHLSHLPVYVFSVIRKPGFSFAEHLKKSSADQTLHLWISQAFIAFRELELRLSLADFAPLFRQQA